jgi:hypothetical protein
MRLAQFRNVDLVVAWRPRCCRNETEPDPVTENSRQQEVVAMSYKSTLVWGYMLVIAIVPHAAVNIVSIPAAFADETVNKETFVTAVLSANKFEIDSSKRVLQKSGSDEVKAFAELMIADHTKASEELWNVFSKQGGTPKAASNEREQPPTMDLLPQDAER